MTLKTKILHYTPRIICITAILFISLFALDTFNESKHFSEQITAFLIHLVPSFILISFLIIAWKRELTGGILFSAVGIGLSSFIYIKNYNVNHSVWMSIGITTLITIPFLIAGILFIMSYLFKKKQNM